MLPSRRKTHSKPSNISPPAVAVPAPSEQHFISCSAVVHTIFGTNYPFTSLTLNIPNFVISELIDHLPAPRYVFKEHAFYFRRSHLYHLKNYCTYRSTVTRYIMYKHILHEMSCIVKRMYKKTSILLNELSCIYRKLTIHKI